MDFSKYIDKRREKRNEMNKQVIEFIKGDPYYSRELLRLVKEIRRIQHGKTPILSETDREEFIEQHIFF